MIRSTITNLLAPVLGAMLLVATAFALGACNTIAGAGQDIEAAGDTIEDSARETQRQL